MSTAVDKNAELLGSELIEVIRAANDIYIAVVSARSDLASTFRHKPESWDYNNIVKPLTLSTQQYQSRAGTGQQSENNHTSPDGGSGQVDSRKKQRVQFDNNKPDLTK